jgi:hypothetical protein
MQMRGRTLGRDLSQQIKKMMREWSRLREGQEERRREIAKIGIKAMQLWDRSAPHSESNNMFIHMQTQLIVSILSSSTELGRVNNDAFASCMVEFQGCKALKPADRLHAELQLRSRVQMIIEQSLPERSRVLDEYEKQIGILNDFVSTNTSLG